MFRRDLLLGAAALAGAAATGVQAAPKGSPQPKTGASLDLEHILTDLTERYLIRQPEQATAYGLDTGAREGLKAVLADYSVEQLVSDRDYCRRGLSLLAEVDVARLTPAEQIDLGAVTAALELGLGGADFMFGDNTLWAAMNESATPYVVSQQSGAYATVPEFLAAQHRVMNDDDADAYYSRVHGFSRALAQETDRIERDAARGVIPPIHILDNAIAQQAEMLAVPADKSRLVQTLATRIATRRLKGEQAEGVRRLVERQVYPALARQMEALKSLRADAGEEVSVLRFKDGEAYYGWLLKAGTSTGMTAAEIHRTGLDQNAEIEARMDGLLKAQGMTQGSVGQRMAAMGRDPKFLFPDTEKGRAALIAYLNGRIAAVRPRLSRAFTLKLKAPIEVRRVPPDVQDGAGQAYMNFAAMDGSRPAIYYVNLRSTANWPRFALPTLTLHEGVPGHAWQGAYLTETGRLSPIRALLGGFNGYVEGYGLYAEQLGDEIGLYDNDWAGRLGYLQAQRFRAQRLVLDTGLHAQRWSREKAIVWAVEQSGRTRDAMTSEIDRYAATPGQACGYKIGQNEINRLRDKARAAAGAGFDVRAFNDLLLVTGPVPLGLLEQAVDRQIAGGAF